jgi:hypothetical protein
MSGNGNGELLELTSIADVFADDIHHVEVIGDNCRMVFFRWRMIEGTWRRVAVEWAMVRPIKSLHLPLPAWGSLVTPQRESVVLHS